MRKPSPRTLLLTIPLLLFLALAIWNQTKLKEKPTGAAIRFTQQNKKPPLGISDVELLLHQNLSNKLHQRRNPYFLHSHPQLFGERKPFKPFLKILLTGPGFLSIQGNGATNPIQTPVPKGTWELEIYPEFHFQKLLEGTSGDRETITLSFQSYIPWKHQKTQIQTRWSGPNDLFLSTENLQDLAALLPKRNTDHPKQTPQAWLHQFQKELENTGWRYLHNQIELTGNAQGWQTLQTEKEIWKSSRANCLDISLYTAKKAMENHLHPYLIANSGHIISSIGPPNSPFKETYPFDATHALKQPLKPQTNPSKPPEEYPATEPLPTPQRYNPPNSPPTEKLFQINLPFWQNFYRTPNP